MSKPRIAVIVSSIRNGRFADKPAAWFMDKVRDHAELDFELVDLRDFDLPLFTEPASNAYMPASDPRAVKWQETINSYDGYVFILHEYGHGIGGALKNALDHDSVGWARKPMAAVAYGSMGGARALEQLRLVAVELHMVSLRNAVHIGGGDFFQVWNAGGDAPISSIEANLQPSLDATLEELVWWTNATKAAREA